MTGNPTSVTSRLVTRVMCVFAPGTGKHRLYTKLDELSEQAAREHKRAEEAEARAQATERKLAGQLAAVEALQGQLQTAMRANEPVSEAPEEKSAPQGFLERVLAQAPEDPPPPAPAADEAVTIPMSGITAALRSYKVVPLRDMALLPGIPTQRVSE